MYYLHHYVIDWDKVQSLDDVKRILKTMNIAFARTCDLSSIEDLVVLQEKPGVKIVPL